jgi:hypothetical protein
MTIVAPRPTKREAFENLKRALSLDFIKPEIRQIVLSLVEEKYVEFVQIRLQDRAATGSGAHDQMMLLEPSDLMLELCAALAANDSDRILAIDHRLHLPRDVEAV